MAELYLVVIPGVKPAAARLGGLAIRGSLGIVPVGISRRLFFLLGRDRGGLAERAVGCPGLVSGDLRQIEKPARPLRILRKGGAVKRAIAAVLLVGFLFAVPSSVPLEAAGPSSAGSGQVKALLVVNNTYGANYNLLRDVMDLYGWQTTVVGVTPTVTQCFYGGPITVDLLVTDLADVSPYDCLIIMPAKSTDSHRQLLASPEALALVGQAVEESLLVVAFCGGTRVLAAAQVIDGVRVTGNPDFLQEYLDAGAIWAGDTVPPVLDGNILTTRRGQYYSHQICEVMRTAVDSLRVLRGRN